MEPALGVAMLLLLFAGTHIGLATSRLRSTLFARLGEVGFTVLFSLVAVVTFAALIHHYAVHRFEGRPGLALGEVVAARWLLMALIVTGVTLAVAGVVVFPRSPMALHADPSALPRGLARITRHPFLVGMALVACGHALLASRLVGTVAFGGLALFAMVGAWHQDRKLLGLRGRPYAEYLAATSAVPFAALLAGRQKLVWRELPVGALAMGLVAAFALRAIHGGILSAGGAWVIGVTVAVPVLLGFEAWRRVRGRPGGNLSRPPALAAVGSALLAYVGIVHEVVGATLYPDGPARFGGPVAWHAAGLLLTGVGMFMLAATLGLLRAPVVPLAAGLGVVGAVFVALQAALDGGFHFFAFTMLVAGALVVVTAPGKE